LKLPGTGERLLVETEFMMQFVNNRNSRLLRVLA
jgi:hypothetical protein